MSHVRLLLAVGFKVTPKAIDKIAALSQSWSWRKKSIITVWVWLGVVTKLQRNSYQNNNDHSCVCYALICDVFYNVTSSEAASTAGLAVMSEQWRHHVDYECFNKLSDVLIGNKKASVCILQYNNLRLQSTLQCMLFTNNLKRFPDGWPIETLPRWCEWCQRQ